jgi:hypothetical protein
MARPNRCRAYVFTLHDPTPEDEEILRDKALDCKYLVFGREVAPTTGRPHLQGFVHLVNAKNPTAFKEWLGLSHSAYVAPSRDPRRAIEYCKKDGDFFEWGTPPLPPEEARRRGGEATAARYQHAIDVARNARYQEAHPQLYLTQLPNMKRIRLEHLIESMPKVTPFKSLWITGPSRCGKSFWARNTFADSLYIKMANKWWEGYDGEKVILLEDFGESHVKELGDYLKIWADVYDFKMEIKGGGFTIRPMTLIVTSNYLIEELFPDARIREPLQNRFDVVTYTGYLQHSPYPEWVNDPRLRGVFGVEDVQPESEREASVQQMAAVSTTTTETSSSAAPSSTQDLGESLDVLWDAMMATQSSLFHDD